jgi:NADH-quinone oxidoreductase subunit E
MATTLPVAEQKVVERRFSPEAEAEVAALVKRYPERRAALLMALRIAEREFGSVDLGGMKLVAERLGLTPAYVMATVSFYTHFRRPTDGTFVIEVCRTLPCALRGADDFARHVSRKLGIAPGETTKDGRFTLKNAECMAACDKAPLIQVNGHNFDLLDAKTFDQVFDELVKNPDGFDLRRGYKDPHPWTKAADPKAQRTKPEGQRDLEWEALTHEPQLLSRTAPATRARRRPCSSRRPRSPSWSATAGCAAAAAPASSPA